MQNATNLNSILRNELIKNNIRLKRETAQTWLQLLTLQLLTRATHARIVSQCLKSTSESGQHPVSNLLTGIFHQIRPDTSQITLGKLAELIGRQGFCHYNFGSLFRATNI